MGVTNFFAVFGSSKVDIKDDYFLNKVVGIDLSYDIYRACLGSKSLNTLTDKDGNPTILINTILNNIVKYKKLGVKGLIYVLDNPVPNKHKESEHKKRKEKKEKAIKKYKDATADTTVNESIEDEPKTIEKLEKGTFRMTKSMIDDIKKLLSLLGVAWIIAPENFEAEQLASKLSIDGVIDLFVTTDSDSLLFGLTNMVKKTQSSKIGKANKKSKLELYSLEHLLSTFNITRDELINIGVVMGCDFCQKTKGIGVKTVLAKYKNIELTAEQIDAMKYFNTSCPYTIDMIVKKTRNKKELITWLIEAKNFNETRITKLLEIFKD
jgi:flap endonuclease-1